MLKCWARVAAVAVGLGMLLVAGVLVARWVALRPSAPYRAAAAALALETPVAEVAAEVQVRLGVQLNAQDVAAWRRMVVQGEAKAEALRIVVAYRQAAGGER
ncbi:MAG: hypothetical protein ACI4RT_08945 [Candidatus Spyradenecus sp.]